jgi:rhodanese-related sulfurtransferase
MVVKVMRAAVLPLLATVALAGCGSDASTPAPPPAAAAPAPSYADLAATAVRQVQAGDAKLLDVRTEEEWDAGHAPQAERFELSRLEAGELPDVPKDAKIHVYCRSGNRATTAVEILEQAGYTDVTNIGGLTDWQAAGGDVTT